MSHTRIILIVVTFVICYSLRGNIENHKSCANRGFITANKYILHYKRLSSFNYLHKGTQVNNDHKGNGWEEMYFRSIKINNKFVNFIVSTELEPVNPSEGFGNYGGHNLFDDDSTTAWVEGAKGQGMGEYVIFKTDEYYPESIRINSGYQKSKRLFKMNSRPKTLHMSLYAGFHLEGDDTELASLYRIMHIAGPEVIELDDRMGSQSFEIPFNPEKVNQLKDSLVTVFNKDFREEIEQRKRMCPTCDLIPMFSFFIKLEINDIYEGSEWDDNCISEISCTSKPFSTTREAISIDEKIVNVYEDEDPDSGLIYFDTDRRKRMLLIDIEILDEYRFIEDNQHLSITLMDVSPDKEWAQVDLMIYTEGMDRIEEYSILYNVRMLRRVDNSILDLKYGMFGFVEDNGKIWLDTIDGLVDLNEIREEMNNE